jgi:hypothetical protein
MPGPLVSADYVALIGDRTFTTDEVTRATNLIPIASNLVRQRIKRDVSSTTAPENAKLAVARLVLSVFDSGASGDGNLRAEQIGDYRVEFQRAPAVQIMDMDIVEDLLKSITRRSRSVRVNIPQDGESGRFDETITFYTGPNGHQGYER